MKIIGVDIGGTKCAISLAIVPGGIEIINKIKFDTKAEKGFEYTKGKLFDSIREIMKSNRLQPNDIKAIGVSCGGPLNSKKGIIMSPPNLPGWTDIHFTDMLMQEFGIPAYLQNDAKACALVEWRLGAGKNTQNMLFLTMGTGMGCGIIANGSLVTGTCDMAGEVGHIRIAEDGPVGYGKTGSFEGFCSGGGIALLAKEQASKALEIGDAFEWGRSAEEIQKITTKLIAEKAKQGDAAAMNIFTIVGAKLGKALAFLIDTLNPEVIVIGSIFTRCEDLIRPSMERELERECISVSLKACKILPAATGDAIGDYASVIVAIDGANISF